MKFYLSQMRAKYSNPFRCLTILSLVLGMALSGFSNLQNWTLDDVLAKVTEANGGEEAIAAVRTASVRGAISSGESVMEFLIVKKRPDKVRLRMSRLGRFVEMAYDGKDGWMRVQDHAGTRVTDLDESGWRTLADEADFDGPMIGAAGEGTERALLGIERIDRTDFFVVEIRR